MALVKERNLFPEIQCYKDLFKDKIHNFGTIHKLYFDESDKDLARFCELLSTFHDNYNYVFRGQRNANWKLSTTWHREKGNPTSSDVISHLASIEKSLPHEQLTSGETIEKLMLAQHHDYSTPLLDFSYHPYIALHFAFREATLSEYYSTVYILLRQNFRIAYTDFFLDPTLDYTQQIRDIQSRGHDFHQAVLEESLKEIEDEVIAHYIREVTIDKTTKLSQLAENRIYMIPNQPKANDRMNKQEGLFIYDMQHYATNSPYGSDFEDFISKLKVSGEKFSPVLIKAHISRQHACVIRKLLDEVNITEVSLGRKEDDGTNNSKKSHHRVEMNF